MGLQGKSVLCIDDDQDFLILVKKILENVGMHVQTSLNLGDAMVVLSEMNPDVILLDLNLEFESGKRLLKLKKRHPSLSKIPIMVCSGENKKETVEKVIALGGNGYILKPIKQTHLIHSLRRIFQGNERPVYKFENQKPPVKVSINSNLLLLSETKCVVRSSLKMNEGQALDMESDLFKEENINFEKLVALKQSQPSTNGLFDTTLSLVGLSEDEIRRIKNLKSSWSTNER